MFKDPKRVALILLALFMGGAVPIQLITLSFGYAQYIRHVLKGPSLIQTAHAFASFYIPFVYLPSLTILLGITLYTRKHYPDVFRRISVGFSVGAFSTIFLDFFRQMGVIYHWLPGDTPLLFGKTVLGGGPFLLAYLIGFLVHFLNGADFGLVYTFVWGKQKHLATSIFWAVFWLLLVEIGMMALPPMAPMVGPFGKNFAWPQLFLITLVAHIAFGISLGVLTHHFLHNEDRGHIFHFLKGG